MWLAKKAPVFCPICPEVLLPEDLRLVNRLFGKFQSGFFMICFQQRIPPWSSSIKSTLAQTVTGGAIWHWLGLRVHLYSLWKLFWALWLPIILSVLSICHQFLSREVGPTELLINMCNVCHWNITQPLPLTLFSSTFFRQLVFFASSSPRLFWCAPWCQTVQWLPLNRHTDSLPYWRHMWC